MQTKLLNLANAAAAMDIMYRLEVALAGVENFTTHCLKLAIRNKQPDVVIIKTCKDMIRDNREVMENIIGKSLVTKIVQYNVS